MHPYCGKARLYHIPLSLLVLEVRPVAFYHIDPAEFVTAICAADTAPSNSCWVSERPYRRPPLTGVE